MKVSVIAFGVLVAAAAVYSYPHDLARPDDSNIEPRDEHGLVLVQPDETGRPKRSLLLGGALGAGAIGAGLLGAGALGAGLLGAGVVGAKAGFLGGALVSGLGRSYGGYGRSYGGYGGYYGGGYSSYGGYGVPYGGYGGYRSYYPSSYVVNSWW